MTDTRNALDQPVGPSLPDWAPPPWPPREPIAGRFCRVEPLDPWRHAEDLHAANREDPDGRSWTYMPYGPFATLAEYRAWLQDVCSGEDPQFFAIVEQATGRPSGVASWLRIKPESGSIEVGHIHYAPRLMRTPAATEAMYLMMRQAFELGYRRYEWKCDALNAASCAAARRLGFVYEGIFRQATVYKGRNRDTAWYSVIDAEWPGLRRAFEAWLAPANFDEGGHQRTRLGELMQTRPTGTTT